MRSYRVFAPLTGPGPTYVHASDCNETFAERIPDGYVMTGMRAEHDDLATRTSQRVAWITHRIPTEIIIAACCDTAEAVAS